MKHVLFLLSLIAFFGTAASAATLSCKQLHQAYEQDLMNESPYECGQDKACRKRQIAQMKVTIELHLGESVSGTLEELEAEYDPIFSLIHVGANVFETVNVVLGSNPHHVLFVAETTKKSGITISDGSIEVDGKYCKQEFAFEPVINSSRRFALCREIVPKFKAKYPETALDVAGCANATEDETAQTEFDVEKFSKTRVQISARRYVKDVGKSFLCKAWIHRTTKRVSTSTCKMH